MATAALPTPARSPRHARGRYHLTYVAAGTLLAASLSPGPARAGDTRTQWWNELAHQFPAGKKAVVATSASIRVFEGFDIDTWNAEVNIMFKAGARGAWGPGFKLQEEREPGGAFEKENRYQLVGKAKLGPPAWRWKPDLRGIYEYRDREDRDATWRFRLRPGVKRVLGSTGWTFVAQEEVFYDSAQDRISQNRLRLGGEHHLGGESSVLLFYLLRSDYRGGSWEKTHVVGSAWTF